VKQQRNTNNMQKFLTNSKRYARKTLIYQEYSITIARDKHPRGSALLPSTRQVTSIQIASKREICDLSKRGENFSHVYVILK
jgi:hypothetical protein